MALTLDTLIAGMKAPEPILKVGGTMKAAGVPHTFWYSNGRPAAATANSAGVNGQAVSAPYTGQIPRTNPSAPVEAYLARLSMTTTITGSLLLIDRLWENSGLVTTSTSAQAISPATLPARDLNGSTNGEAVMAAIEWSAAGGAGTPTVTLTYTDQSGNTGATASLVGSTTPPIGTFEIFPLAAGDTGVQAPTSFIQSATRTSGTMHLVLFRVIAQLELPIITVGNAIDMLTSGRPRIYDSSVLQLVYIPSAATAATITGTYIETQADPT